MSGLAGVSTVRLMRSRSDVSLMTNKTGHSQGHFSSAHNDQ